jgi:hypothetical protein
MRPIVQAVIKDGLGNQLFRYAFAKAYAERNGAVLETNPWIGQRLFEIDDPPYSTELTSLKDGPFLPHPAERGPVNIRLDDFFWGSKHLAYYSVSWAKKVFQWRGEIIKSQWWDIAKNIASRPYVAMHIRRGDYVTEGYPLVSEASYERAYREYALYVYSPIRRVTDGQVVIRQYEGYESFLGDFFTLMLAPVLLRANSTFSWWAATLGDGRVYSPVIDQPGSGPQDVPFILGNTARIWPGTEALCLKP